MCLVNIPSQYRNLKIFARISQYKMAEKALIEYLRVIDNDQGNKIRMSTHQYNQLLTCVRNKFNFNGKIINDDVELKREWCENNKVSEWPERHELFYIIPLSNKGQKIWWNVFPVVGSVKFNKSPEHERFINLIK